MPSDAPPLHPALRPFVTSVHSYDVEGYPAGEHVGMPSAAVTLVIALDPLLDVSMPGRPRRRMRTCLAGLHSGPATIYHDGTQRGLHISLTPLGLRRLLGIPASAIVGEAVELSQVVGDAATERLLDQVATAPSWSAVPAVRPAHRPRGRYRCGCSTLSLCRSSAPDSGVDPPGRDDAIAVDP